MDLRKWGRNVRSGQEFPPELKQVFVFMDLRKWGRNIFNIYLNDKPPITTLPNKQTNKRTASLGILSIIAVFHGTRKTNFLKVKCC